jgi:hypothetical protein
VHNAVDAIDSTAHRVGIAKVTLDYLRAALSQLLPRLSVAD